MADTWDFTPPDRALAVQRAAAFRQQAARVNAEVERLWLMRDYVEHPEDNMDVRFAGNTLRHLLGEAAVKKEAA